MAYTIIRSYAPHINRADRIIKRGLTLEQAQAALLSAVVWLINKGMELQADENAAAAAAATIAKRTNQRR